MERRGSPYLQFNVLHQPRSEPVIVYTFMPHKPSSQTAYMAVSAYDSSGNSSLLSEEVGLSFVYLPVVLKNHH